MKEFLGELHWKAVTSPFAISPDFRELGFFIVLRERTTDYIGNRLTMG